MKLEDIKRTLTVVPSQKLIVIDDVPHECEFSIESPMPQYGAIRAIQYLAGHGGQIEYMLGPAVGFPLEAESGIDARWLTQFLGPWLEGRVTAAAARLENAQREHQSFRQALEIHDQAIQSLHDALASHVTELAVAEAGVRSEMEHRKTNPKRATHTLEAYQSMKERAGAHHGVVTHAIEQKRAERANVQRLHDERQALLQKAKTALDDAKADLERHRAA